VSDQPTGQESTDHLPSVAWPPSPQNQEYQRTQARLLPGFRPVASLAPWVVILLLSNIFLGTVSELVVTLANAVGPPAIPGWIWIVLNILGPALGIACVVVFLVWVYRVCSNLSALGAPRPSITPGWAVGYFFIPILNLYKPYLALRDAWQASDPGGDLEQTQTERSTTPVGWWWAAWLIWNAADSIAFAFNQQLNSTLGINSGSMISYGISIFTYVTAIRLVNNLTKRQEEAARRLAG
jgi:hypothetical protein